MSAAEKIAEARAIVENIDAAIGRNAFEAMGYLYAAAPGAAKSFAALADLADAQAQEISELRAENERMRNMALLARFSEVFAGSHRHLKSGGLYDHIGTGRIQSEQPLTDMDAVEIYIGVNGDLWARRQAEFHDGRFDEISPALGETP